MSASDLSASPPTGGVIAALLDRMTDRLVAGRWVVCVLEDSGWSTYTTQASLRDELLARAAPDIPEGATMLNPSDLGDVGARITTSGVSRLAAVSSGASTRVFFENPAPDADLAPIRGLIDLDLSALIRSSRLASGMEVLATWLPTLADVATGKLGREDATERLTGILRMPVTLSDNDEIEVAGETVADLGVLSRLLRLVSSAGASASDARRNVLLRERARIASVIHEGITQVLTNVAIQLDVLDHVLDDPDQARSMIRESRVAVLEALDSLRTVIFDLTPKVEDWGDLDRGLEKFVADFAAQWGLQVDVMTEGAPREVDAEVVSVVFAFVQECLTNVRKHAVTETASVTLAFTDDEVAVAVTDGGIGMPSEIVDGGLRTHHGLAIMHSRVSLLGGRFEIARPPAGGTEVRMVIPA